MIGGKERFTMLPKVNFYRFNRVVTRLFYMFVGMPRCGRDKFKNEVLVLKPTIEEIEFYRKSEQLHNSQIIYFIWFTTWILKNLYFSVYMIVTVSHIEVSNDLDLNANLTISGTTQYRRSIYGCLITNCTRLSKQNTFVKDFKELPVFEICHPNLKVFYSPLVATHSVGLNIYTVLTYLTAIAGVYFPIENYIHPRVSDTSLFPLTPTFSIRSHRERAKKYMIAVFASMGNYHCEALSRCRNSIDVTRIRETKSIVVDLENSLNMAKRELHSIHMGPERSSLNLLKPNYLLLSREVKDYLSDCLPLARSYAWSAKANEVFALMWINSFVSTVFVSMTGIWLMINYGSSVSDELSQTDTFIQYTGCGFWIEDQRESVGLKSNTVSLSETVQHRNWVYLFELFTILLPGFIVFSSNLTCAISYILEINFMMNEQLVHADLALRFAELLKSNRIESNQTEGIDIKAVKGCFRMA